MTAAHLVEVIGNEQDVWDLLPRVLAAAARDGVDIGDLLRHACSEGTRLLPKGMDLTENRPGSWEAGHVASLTDPSAVDEGPVAGPLDIECPRCHTPAGEPCFDTRLYTYNKHPHRERVVAAPSASFSVQYGWTAW